MVISPCVNRLGEWLSFVRYYLGGVSWVMVSRMICKQILTCLADRRVCPINVVFNKFSAENVGLWNTHVLVNIVVADVSDCL